MREINIIIVDDDKDWLQTAGQILQRFADQKADRKISLHCYENADSTLAELTGSKTAAGIKPQTAAPDLAFLDIEFGTSPDGIGLAGQLNERFPACQIVYLTNYLHYALDVYQTDHIWYVLKPQFEERLPEIFSKLAAIRNNRETKLSLTAADGHIVTLRCGDILYLERQTRMTRIVTVNSSYHTRSRIPELAAKLPAGSFARCHNSYIVNLTRVSEIYAKSILLEDGSEILISRGYSRSFRAAWMAWAESITV